MELKQKFTLESLMNDTYKVLAVLYDNAIFLKKATYTPLSQAEIADLAHFSKMKTHKLLHELMDYNLIEPYNGKKGKYRVTRYGVRVVKTCRAVDLMAL